MHGMIFTPTSPFSPSCCVQVKLIRDKFKAALGDDARLVDVNTIDGFQVFLCIPITARLR